MKMQMMKRFGKTVVASLAAFTMLVQPFTAAACPAEAHVDTAECEEGHSVEGSIILYNAQFVDEDGNVYPVSEITPQVFCPGHEKYDGYFQTHVADGKGGCTVKTYKGVKCVICDTIWLGDLINTSIYAKCPHDI
mgnify:CR=1 FL=1